MTTRELFNRWFRNKKKVPVFNEDVDVVCKANQIMTEDGKNVEDVLKTGGGGSAPLKLTLIGSPDIEADYSFYNILPDEMFLDDFIPRRDTKLLDGVKQSEVELLLNASEGDLVIIYFKAWYGDGLQNWVARSEPIGIGCIYNIDQGRSCYINEHSIVRMHPIDTRLLLNTLRVVRVNSQEGTVLWVTNEK